MLVEAHVTINAPKSAVWAVITNIEHAAEILTGVEKVEIVEKPPNGLVGLSWRETRMYFGKEATVEKRITDAVENESYKTRTEDSGFLFIATMTILESGNGVSLTSSHETRPQGFVAKLKSAPMFLFKGVIKKALVQDLDDYKSAVEKK